MKKHWTMRVAVLMVALTLITSCFVSGTYAKYVTSGSATDQARVAKFGVTVTATGSAFGTSYYDVLQTESNQISATYTAGTDSVKSDGTGGTYTKVVAPGTGDDVAVITLTGTPEVDVRVSVAATLSLTGWTTDGTDEYCPIVFTVNGQTYGTNDSNATNKSADVAALITAVQNAINALTRDYEALTNLATATNAANQPILPISWAWPFSTSAANDIKDTALGDRAAADVADAAHIDITITTTVTQID